MFGGSARHRDPFADSEPAKVEKSNDTVVQSTNDDAATSKLAAVRTGYYKDDALELLLDGNEIIRRAPIMLRGYYIRSYIMRDVVRKFLMYQNDGEDMKYKQIVNLGAGFDTLYFWLKNENLWSDNIGYYELDFQNVFKRKVNSILKKKELVDLLGGESNIIFNEQEGSLDAGSYHIIPTDLRKLDLLRQQLESKGFNTNQPTLFLSECVLIYMEAEHSQAIISWIQKEFETALFCCYEQIKPNDPFGKMMIQNLERRGCALLGLKAFPDEDSQIKRFINLGWTKAESYNMNILYQRYIPETDRRRIERIQMLDEVEEWELINEHYCISWAICDKSDSWKSLKFL